MIGLCSASDPMQLLKNRIIDHEGLKTKLYKDDNGYYSIGVGHLLDPAKGGKLSVNACMFILGEDIADAQKDLMPYAWFDMLHVVRQGMLIEMCFNIGIDGVLKFHDMIAAITKQDYHQAALCFLNSLEAKQIHADRANDMAYRLEFGVYK